jgi:hypothetical protein
MSSATERHDPSRDANVGQVDMKLEVDIIPVSDVDRSKEFYERLGWRLDDDVAPLDGLRIVQFTPPGSGTSVTFGLGLTTATRPSRRLQPSWRTRDISSGCGDGRQPVKGRRPLACTAPTARLISMLCSPTCRSPTGCVSR